MSTINSVFKFMNGVTTATRNNAAFQASGNANNRNTLMRNILGKLAPTAISLNTRLHTWSDRINAGTSRNFVVDRSGDYVLDQNGLPTITRGS